ncbi:MAG: hypothetical protein ACD_28C00087G0001 [uncultured bacterium]|nr:MAG: hypothetical protein ACD_28C00087G0001 [uncultured bacterium]KKT74620.1 MAG: hypothetical protein UW70_C0049G0013 [Candidatus Peregrinibacteria bacterium GW2011_GWA2_44_7]
MTIPESSSEDLASHRSNGAFLRLDNERDFREYHTEDGLALIREELESYLLRFNPHESGQSEFPNSAIPIKEVRADRFSIIDLVISPEKYYQKRNLRIEILDFLQTLLARMNPLQWKVPNAIPEPNGHLVLTPSIYTTREGRNFNLKGVMEWSTVGAYALEDEQNRALLLDRINRKMQDRIRFIEASKPWSMVVIDPEKDGELLRWKQLEQRVLLNKPVFCVASSNHPMDSQAPTLDIVTFGTSDLLGLDLTAFKKEKFPASPTSALLAHPNRAADFVSRLE